MVKILPMTSNVRGNAIASCTPPPLASHLKRQRGPDARGHSWGTVGADGGTGGSASRFGPEPRGWPWVRGGRSVEWCGVVRCGGSGRVDAVGDRPVLFALISAPRPFGAPPGKARAESVAHAVPLESRVQGYLTLCAIFKITTCGPLIHVTSRHKLHVNIYMEVQMGREEAEHVM